MINLRELFLKSSAFERLALLFWKGGVLVPAEIYAADSLGREAGVDDAEVLLALALALRAPRLGHVGVELENAARQVALEERRDLPWPQAPAWLGKTAGCAGLVDQEGGGRQPFVLVDKNARPCAGGQPLRLLTRRYFELEQSVAERLSGLLRAEPLLDERQAAALVEEAMRALEATEELRRALVGSLRRRLLVLTGGPGSGKTFACKFMLYAHWLAAGGKPPSVALAAPTGKAAQRMKQALAENLERYLPDPQARQWIGALEPLTLHRLLGASRGWPRRFGRGAERPLEQRLILVDEASMIDLALMDKLLAALTPDKPQTLVLMGDANQLASVEAGCVLRDLTLALSGREDFLVQLSGQHRLENDSLRQLARLVVEGRAQDVLEMIQREGPGISFITLAGQRLPPRALDFLRSNLLPYVEACRRPAPELLSAWEKFGLLTPYRRGWLGVEDLNRTAENLLGKLAGEKLHREGWFDASADWYPGKAVMVTENRYDLGLFNGDVGVARPAGEQLRVHFSAGDFLPGVLSSCQTAFALTVHKAQGSQFERVALVLGERDSQLVTRELVYTAITRARRELIVIAHEGELQRALSRTISRASGLDRLLARG